MVLSEPGSTELKFKLINKDANYLPRVNTFLNVTYLDISGC